MTQEIQDAADQMVGLAFATAVYPAQLRGVDVTPSIKFEAMLNVVHANMPDLEAAIIAKCRQKAGLA